MFCEGFATNKNFVREISSKYDPTSYSICLFSTHLQPFSQSQYGSRGEKVLAGIL